MKSFYAVLIVAACVAMSADASFLRELKGKAKCETFTVCSFAGTRMAARGAPMEAERACRNSPVSARTR